MQKLLTPDTPPPAQFTDAAQAVAHLEKLYGEATGFLCEQFKAAMKSGGRLSAHSTGSQQV